MNVAHPNHDPVVGRLGLPRACLERRRQYPGGECERLLPALQRVDLAAQRESPEYVGADLIAVDEEELEV